MAGKIRLIDNNTQRVVAVNPTKASDLVRSGTYSFIPGTEVELHSPDGEGFITDADNATAALMNGFQIDTDTLKKKRQVMAEYGEQDIAAGLAGAARGLSLGLSDQVLVDAGVSPETLSNLEEANPVVSGTAEIGSFIGSLLLSGGTSAAAKGASIGARAVTGAGKVAEKTLQKAIMGAGGEASASLARKFIAKSGGAIAQGATEGAIFEVGQLVSEDALGRAELNAETLMAQAGVGAIIGGSAGILFKGIETAIPALTKATSKGIKEGQKRFLSQEKAVMDLYGVGKRDLNRLGERGIQLPEVATVTDDIIRNMTKDDDFLTAFTRYNKSNRDNLTKVYEQGDEAARVTGLTVDDVLDVNKYIAKIDEVLESNRGSVFADQTRQLRRLKKDLQTGQFLPLVDGTTDPFNPFKAAKSVLDQLDNLAKFEKGANPTLAQTTARDLRKLVREDINKAVQAQKGKLGPEGDALFTEIQKMNRKAHVLATLKPMVEDLDRKRMTQRALSFRDIVSIGVGSAVADTAGAIGALAGKLGSFEGVQLFKFRALSKMESTNQTVASRLANAINRIGEGVSASTSTARLGGLKALSEFTFDPEKAKLPTSNESREDAFKRVSEEINNLSEPQAKVQLLERTTETLSQVAPKTSMALGMKMVTAIDFLQSKLPVNPYMGRVLNPVVKKWKPSRVEIAKFERYVNAVNDPASVVKQFADGVVNREGLEVLRTVYPEIFTELQAAVQVAVAQTDKLLPYKVRLQLGTLLDVNVDPSTEAQTVLMLQSNLASGPEHQMAMGPSPSRKVDLSGRVDQLTTQSQDTAFSEDIA